MNAVTNLRRRVEIHRRFLSDGYQLDVELVTEAARTREPVGSCRCGHYLHADGVPRRGFAGRGPLWVHLVCGGCGYEVAAPDGRLAGRRQHDAQPGLSA